MKRFVVSPSLPLALAVFILLLVPTLVVAYSRSGNFDIATARIAKQPAKQVVWSRQRALRGFHRADPDRDGLRTKVELRRTKTNPHKFDTDGDGYGDGAEVAARTNPRSRASHPRPFIPPAAAPTPTPTPDVDTTAPEATTDPDPDTDTDPGPDTDTDTDPGPPVDTTAPETTIAAGPDASTTSTSASFAFSSSEGGSSFRCRLDAGSWKSCSSPTSYDSLALGTHTFSVRATDAAGNTDATPATQSWAVQAPDSSEADCTQTLAPGANIGTAISSAPKDAVICLNGGSGSINLNNVTKSNVTLRGPGTLGYSTLQKTAGINLSGLHFTGGVELLGATHDIEIFDNEFTGKFGIRANGEAQSNGTKVSGIRIEDNYLHDLNFTGSEGVSGGYGMTLVNGVQDFTIRGNTIKSVANDYIQSASPVAFTVDHNTFLGPSLRYTHAEVHQDLWQIFGGGTNVRFTNNVAHDTGTHESLLFQEGTFHDTVVENNLLDNDSDGYTCMIYQQQGLVFRYNTIVDSRWGCMFRDDASRAAGSNYQIDHNVFADTEDASDIAREGRAGSWGTYDYNVSSDGSAGGSHSVRNWSPSWVDRVDYSPLGLSFTAGYRKP